MEHGDRVVIAKSSGAILDASKEEGETMANGDVNRTVEVEGYAGQIDGELYENSRGEISACVKVDNGGGVAGVPLSRLEHEDHGGSGARTFGFGFASQDDWDRIFGKKKRRRRKP